MKKIALLVSAALASGALAGCNTTSTPGATAPQATQAQSKIFNQDYVFEELDNGLRVMVVKTDYPDVVSLQIPVQTGSRNEVEQGKSGFAHFFEHMMFKGTPEVPQPEYDRILKNAGADGNAYTSDDLTNYHTSFPKAHLETMLKLEADRFQNLTYSEAVFRTEAQAVKGEFLKNYSNPYRKLFGEVRELAYDVHPYKHTTMGYLRDIEQMPEQMEYAKTFFKRWYSPQFATIIVVGDVDPQQTLNWVKQYWGDWKRNETDFDIPQEPEQTQPRYAHKQFDNLPQTYVSFNFHTPALDEEQKDKPALDLMGEVYFSETSDFYQKVVIQEQWADQFFFYSPNRKDPSLSYLIFRLKDEKFADEVKAEVAKTLTLAKTQLVDEKRLAAIKSNLKYSFAQSMDSSGAIGSTLASYTHFERDPEFINRLYQTFDKIQPADIRAAAEKYFTDARRVTVTMSDKDKLQGFGEPMQLDAMLAKAKAAKPAKAGFEFVDMANSSDIIDVNLLFNTGAADDPAGKKGLAALTAAMLTQGGSASMSFKDIQNAMYPLASSFNYQIDKEMLSFRSRVHKDNLDAWYALVKEQLLNPGWKEDDFARLKDNLITSIKSDLKASNDEELGKEVLYAELYQGHPYASYNLGRISDIEKLTLDDVKAFYANFLTQSRLTLGIAGNAPQGFKDKIKTDLTGLPMGNGKMASIPDAPALKGHKVTIVDKPSTTSTAVSFGFPIDVTRSDKDWTALWLVRSWLGEHRSGNSHLFQRIRKERGMNYGDYAYIEYFPRGMFRNKPNANLGRSEQIFQVWLRPLRSNNDAHFATRVAIYEMQKLIKNGMDQKSFETTRNFLSNFVPQMVTNQARILGYELDSRYYGTDEFVAMVRKQLASLTLEDVNRVIAQNLQLDDVQYVFISPDAQDMKQRLASEQSSPLKYNSEKPQEITEEDKQIENLKLDIKSNAISIKPLDEVFM